jgi:hypothetical protein
MRFQVLTAVSTKMAVLWIVEPCRLVRVYRRFRGVCCKTAGVKTESGPKALLKLSFRYMGIKKHTWLRYEVAVFITKIFLSLRTQKMHAYAHIVCHQRIYKILQALLGVQKRLKSVGPFKWARSFQISSLQLCLRHWPWCKIITIPGLLLQTLNNKNIVVFHTNAISHRFTSVSFSLPNHKSSETEENHGNLPLSVQRIHKSC